MMAIFGKGIKYPKKSKTRENNAKTEKKLPENYMLCTYFEKRSKVDPVYLYLPSLVL